MTAELKCSILYVDDEYDNLKVFSSAFGKIFDVTTVDSPSGALDLMRSNHYDIVVSDQRMPSITGVELFQIMEREGIPAVRILLTGYADMQVIVQAINKGQIYHYCTKPWSLEEFKIILNKAFKVSRNKRELSESVESLTSIISSTELGSEREKVVEILDRVNQLVHNL